MSWFKTRPRVKEPPRTVAPHRSSPITEKLMNETKKTGPARSKKQPQEK